MMKNYYLSFILVLSCMLNARAQELKSEFSASIDSVQRIINSHSKEDTTKVVLLNDLARFCFFDQQFKRGFIATRQARLMAQKLNYAKGEALFMRTMAFLNDFGFLFMMQYLSIQTSVYYEQIKQTEPI